MQGIKLQPVANVSALINNIQKVKNQLAANLDGVSIFYRGQADESWELKPGVYRNSADVAREHKMLKEMIRCCPAEFHECRSSFERLVKMQHYSLRTRLLDITSNPLVAAYFACSGGKNKGGFIDMYFVRKEDVVGYDDRWVNTLSMMSFIEPDALDVAGDSDKWSRLVGEMRTRGELMPYLSGIDDFDKVLCVQPKQDNPRITRQMGAFFLFGIKGGKKADISTLDVDKITFEVPAHKSTKSGKIVGKETLLQELAQLGIDEKYCFPEIDRVAHYINENK